MPEITAQIKPEARHFLPQDFILTDWETLKPYFQDLQDRSISSAAGLQQWLADLSELDAVISEDASWRQIRMTTDTTNSAYEEAFTYFVTEIEPPMKPYSNALNRRLAESPYLNTGLYPGH